MNSPEPFYFTTYQQWYDAITTRCNIQITPNYAEQRIQALSNSKDPNTKEFVNKYGQGYTNQIIQWFERAKAA